MNKEFKLLEEEQRKFAVKNENSPFSRSFPMQRE